MTLAQRFLISAVIAALYASALEAALWRAHRREAIGDQQKARETVAKWLRAYFYSPLAVALAAYLIFGWGALWTWYSTSASSDESSALMAIAGACITTWAGSLIAFTIAKRLTRGLSHGLRFLLIGAFGSLLALIGNTVALRTAALLAFLVFVPLAVVLLRFQFGLKGRKIQVGTGPVEPKLATEEETAKAAEFGRQAFEDFVDRYAYAGPHFTQLSVLSLVVFVFGNAIATVWVTLILFGRGIQMCFAALVEPFVPKFDRDFFQRYIAQRAAERKAKPTDAELQATRDTQVPDDREAK